MWMETSGQQTKPKNDIIYTTLLTLVFWKEILVPRVCLGTIPKNDSIPNFGSAKTLLTHGVRGGQDHTTRVV